MKKRKQIIVNPKVQLKLIIIIVGIAIIPIIILFSGFMVYANNLLVKIDSHNTAMIQLLESVKTLNYLTFGGFILIIIALAVVMTNYLHKIIGPLYRIETDLENMVKENDLSKKIKVRKGDYIHSLVDAINAALSHSRHLK